MSRTDVRVDARLVRDASASARASTSSRSTRTPPRTTRVTLPGAVGLDWVTDLQGATPPRLRGPRAALADCSAGAASAPSRHHRALRRQQQLVRRLRVLAASCYRGCDGVRLLDGGRKKWELESRPLVRGPDRGGNPRDVPAGDRPARSCGCFRDEVLATVGTGSTAFIDVRSPAEFAGEILAPPHLPQEQAQVPGHIPGARTSRGAARSTTTAVSATSRNCTSSTRARGSTPDRPTIAYCRIGERSAHTWFVLTSC